MSHDEEHLYKIEKSALWTFIGILLLFSSAVVVVLISPRFVDPAWTQPTSYYQVQMYEVGDPNLYVNSFASGSPTLQFVNHLKGGYTLLAFQESKIDKIVAPKELQKYITKSEDTTLKLTSRLLLLRIPEKSVTTNGFNAYEEAQKLEKNLQDQSKGSEKISYIIHELYVPKGDEAFSLSRTDGVYESFVDKNFTILDEGVKQPYHQDPGVIYVKNPVEYRITEYHTENGKGWKYDPNGVALTSLQELKHHKLGFLSRKELISLGEEIYSVEGCWYCHTDQTRTLIQDLVLNGSDTFPAPPSSPNEYIYQYITFPGTKRNGPDISRVGVKKPTRDWHKSHFWAPRFESKGSIMPSFRHFFDDDPRGTSRAPYGIPNYRFEAIYQYLMTKGTRITPPTQAWWIGKDPLDVIKIIEGRKTINPGKS
jgi:cytochrome c oxidase cbb3-type subunit 2